MKIYKNSKDISIKKEINNNSNIEYVSNFLSEEESSIYFNDLIKNPNWMQGTYMMFGKPIKTPRLLWAMRDKNFIVPDSYSVTGNTVFSSLINSLRKKVEEYTGHKLLYAQLNYYRDGNDYIGWHTDSEVKKDDIIASISLGVPRRFVLRYKNYKTNKDIPKHEFELGNGSLLIMDYNASTKYWKHILPKMKKVTDPRINITFRNQ